MMRTSSRKLLGAACVLLITLVGLEVTVRIWGYSQRHIYDPIYTSLNGTEDIPYVHKPNLIAARARGLAVINTDSLGLRASIAGASYGVKQPNEYRIAIVGDSCTFGEGVTRTEDTFAQVLEHALNEGHQALTARVFNYAASAYSVKEMAATLRYRMMDIDPDLVVMVIIPEDFNLSRTPGIDSTGYFVDQRVSFLYDVPLRDILRGVHLLYVLRDLALSWVSSPTNRDGSLALGELPESYRYVRQFRDLAEQRGLPWLIVLLSSPRAIPVGPVLTRFKQDAVTHLDLTSLRSEIPGEQYMASRFDPHPSAAVHRRIGEALADWVRHQPGLAR